MIKYTVTSRRSITPPAHGPIKYLLLHSDWNLDGHRLWWGNALVRIQRKVYLLPVPNLEMGSESFHAPHGIIHVHEQTECKIECDVCEYVIYFRQDGTVDSYVYTD